MATHEPKFLQCAVCSTVLHSKKSYYRHMCRHDGKELFKCDICEKSIFTAYAFRKHKLRHEGEKPLVNKQDQNSAPDSLEQSSEDANKEKTL